MFSINFAGPFPETQRGYKHLLVCVEHLTGWPIVVPTNVATAEIVRDFVSTEIIHPFGIPKVVVSDNAQCFTANIMKEFCEQQGISWKTVLSYAPMSNGRAERMVKTVKSGVAKFVLDRGDYWDIHVRQIVYGYRRRPLASGYSPFELMYGIAPRMTQDDGRVANGPQSTLDDRRAELMMVDGWRATRTLRGAGGKKAEKRAVRMF